MVRRGRGLGLGGDGGEPEDDDDDDVDDDDVCSPLVSSILLSLLSLFFFDALVFLELVLVSVVVLVFVLVVVLVFDASLPSPVVAEERVAPVVVALYPSNPSSKPFSNLCP